MNYFFELSILLSLTAAISFLMKLTKQPLVVGYILTGIIAGPFVLNLIHDSQGLELFSKLGIALLLFVVGLGLNPRVIQEVGRVSLITGVGQVVATSFFGFLLSLLLGLPALAALYTAIALTFSSTIIILKLLADKGDTQTLYGKISVGFLLVQDVIATIILIFVSSFSSTQGLPLTTTIGLLIVKSTLIGCILYLALQYVIPKLINFVGKTQELLFVFSLSWALSIASLFSYMGLSIEIGALIAGAGLASLPAAEEIGSKLRPLRDFFIIVFFILLGAHMDLAGGQQLILPALVLSLFVLIGNPLIVLMVMNWLGYHRRVGFMAGLTVAQISEFSLILASLGNQLGHLDKSVLTLVTMVGLISISGSAYLILSAETIYEWCEKWLNLLELWPKKSQELTATQQPQVLLFGSQRVSDDFVNLFKKMGYSFAIVDYDPLAKTASKQDVPVIYGDAGNTEFLDTLPLSTVKLVICVLSAHQIQKMICQYLKKHAPNATRIFFSLNKSHALELYEEGAHYVIVPHHVGAFELSRLLRKQGLGKRGFTQRRKDHLIHLDRRLS